jgi:transcriptional regulator with XRE-family HTH domain/Zn-dependent peptidase ImmA (M78 family)
MFFDEPETVEFDAVAFGARLRFARQRARVNQVPLAKALGMSQATYSRMEKGRVEPERVTATLLDELSALLGKTMDWFLNGSPVRDRIRLAARAHDTGSIRDRAERVLDLLEADADLDNYAEIDKSPQRDVPRWKAMAEELAVDRGRPSRAQGAAMAEKVRTRLGTGPIGDLPTLLESELDIDTASLPLPDGLSALAAFDDERDIAFVVVDVHEARVRQRFSLAHELAHVLAGDGHAYDHSQARTPTELRADKFAQTLLLPPAEVQQWLTVHGYARGAAVSFEHACELADSYGVSPATAWIALEDLRCTPARPAPTSHDAALVSGRLARFRQRESSAHIARVPQRIESRLLAAYRTGHLSAGVVASLLDSPTEELDTADTDASRPGRSATGNAAAVTGA